MSYQNYLECKKKAIQRESQVNQHLIQSLYADVNLNNSFSQNILSLYGNQGTIQENVGCIPKNSISMGLYIPTVQPINNMVRSLSFQRQKISTIKMEEEKNYQRDNNYPLEYFEVSKEFFPYSVYEIDNIKYHLQKPLQKVSECDSLSLSETSKSYDQQMRFKHEGSFTDGLKPSKGRRRNVINQAESIYDLIFNYALPKWKEYLQFKSERGITNANKARPDTLWKKILRDVREFFRILFRKRFHSLDFKDFKGATRRVKILFEELGIEISDDEMNDLKFFQIHPSNS